jgi:hypothetical protein
MYDFREWPLAVDVSKLRQRETAHSNLDKEFQYRDASTLIVKLGRKNSL